MPRRSGGASDALVLAPEAPYPVIGGGPNRTASVIEYLLQAGRRVHVVTFREPGAPDPRSSFPPEVEADVVPLRVHSKSPPARAWRNIRRAVRGVPPLVDRFSGYRGELSGLLAGRQYDLGIVEHFWCAPYAQLLRQHCDRLVLNLHNIDSVLLRTCAALEPFPASALHHRFAKSCGELESTLLPEFDKVLVTSEDDRQRLPFPAMVYPNAIPLRKRPDVAKTFDIVFSGNLEYAPNLDALRWFASEIWPQLRRLGRDVSWLIVGRNHEYASKIFSSERVTFTGPVDDAISAIAQARVAIVPIRAGSGTRVKILESWAAGVPVVSTRLGAEGLPSGQGAILADTPDEFMAAIIRLLSGEDAEEGRTGRDLYEQSYNWQAVWQILEREGI